MSEQHFEATIVRSGDRACIAIPFDPNAVWGVKERHYIAGSVDGRTIRGPLDSDGNRFFLLCSASWLRDNAVEEGAAVEVVLAPEGPQSNTVSPDITAAFDAEPEARMFFDSLATFYRKNYVRWIESARRPETRQARIAETIRRLKAGEKQR